MQIANYNPDVLSCIASLSNDEVFTPPALANKVLDMLPASLWQDKKITFLDPCTKSGVFLREIAKRLIEGLTTEIPDLRERLHHIYTHQLFGIAITELTGYLSRRSVYCSKHANGKYSVYEGAANEQGNIIFNRTEHTWKNNQCLYCGASKEVYNRGKELETHAYQFIHTDKPENIFNMKFDVIIGNPPYQLSDGGAQASAIPIYHNFVEQAMKLNPRYLTMIIPSRWFAGGRGLDDFRNKMLSDNRIRIMHDYLDARDCFPGVEIKGGVNYFLWDRDNPGLCKIYTYENGTMTSIKERMLKVEDIDIFIRYNQAIDILKKIKSYKEETIDKIISSQRPFGLRTYEKGKLKQFNGSIKLYANKSVGFIEYDKITLNQEWINKHKIIVPRAIGTGDSRSDRIKPIYSEPGSCCSETYVVFGPLENQMQCSNLISYIETKFFHFLVTLRKNTMMAPRIVYSFVPFQNLNETWTDEKLFKKYKLNKEEIEFIESMIRPMESTSIEEITEQDETDTTGE